MNPKVIVVNSTYADHFHWSAVRMSLQAAQYRCWALLEAQLATSWPGWLTAPVPWPSCSAVWRRWTTSMRSSTWLPRVHSRQYIDSVFSVISKMSGRMRAMYIKSQPQSNFNNSWQGCVRACVRACCVCVCVRACVCLCVFIAVMENIHITVQPQSQQALEGGRVVLACRAAGPAGLSYQWFRGKEQVGSLFFL